MELISVIYIYIYNLLVITSLLLPRTAIAGEEVLFVLASVCWFVCLKGCEKTKLS